MANAKRAFRRARTFQSPAHYPESDRDHVSFGAVGMHPRLYEDKRIKRAGPDAWFLWWNAIHWSTYHNSGGYVPRDVARSLADHNLRTFDALSRRLIDNKLWIEVKESGGFLIADLGRAVSF